MSRRSERQAVRAGPPPPFLDGAAPLGPDFFGIGMQKGGTRWLYDQLELHPGFWMPPLKELHYFDGMIDSAKALKLKRQILRAFAEGRCRIARHDRRPFAPVDTDWLDAYAWLSRQPPDLEAYARLFAPKAGLLSGDITPRYATLPRDQAQRLRDRFPRARVIYIARDPVARTWSHFSMMARSEGWQQDRIETHFDSFLELDPPQALSSATAALAAWRRGPEDPDLGLFFFDDLVADPVGLRRRMLSFLGADPAQPSGDRPADYNRKSSREKLEMTPRLRSRVVALCADELRACAATLGGPAPGWARKYGL